ncbi:NYN domain-containing protein [Candidatus Bathyarchaeota archaeon]|nr:NYN domain-containing protein [Candidatus Bathyarchaeota archaeon]
MLKVNDQIVMSHQGSKKRIALFIDFENFFNGVGKSFKMLPVMEQLMERGKLSVTRAYGDWNQFADYRLDLIENGVALIEQTNVHAGGKNGADIKLAIDALDTAFRYPEIDTFAIASGDSDFLPLILKLREMSKYVIIISSRKLASTLLQKNCDEFLAMEIFGDDPIIEHDIHKAIDLLSRVIGIREENGEAMDIAQHKNMMRQLDPSFDEKLYGHRGKFKDFVELLLDEGNLPYHLHSTDNMTWYIVRDKRFAQHDHVNHKSHGWSPGSIKKKQWRIILDTIEQCIKDGEGKPMKGKLWIIMAYMQTKRRKGRLKVDDEEIKIALGFLVSKGILMQREKTIYDLAPGFTETVQEFIASL